MSSTLLNKKWMDAPMLSKEYIEGAKSFIRFTQACLGGKYDWYLCPCVKCRLQSKGTAKDIFEHLICNGMDQSYKLWDHHGEPSSKDQVNVRASTSTSGNHGVMSSRMEELVNDRYGRSDPHGVDVGTNDFQDEEEAQVLNDSQDNVQSGLPEDILRVSREDIQYNKLRDDALQPIYPSCHGGDSKLSTTIELLSMKARHRWSNDSFTELLEFTKRILPDENTLPDKTSSAKSMVNSLRMKCEIIDACRNDCVLYWKEYGNEQSCPKCKESRWKPINESKPNAKPKPWKKLRYFPLTERLQKMYSVPWIAENMTWHANSIETESYLRHPVDSSCWKSVNYRWGDFAAETRNVRLGLATDGFNPFGNKSNAYSCWHVMVVPYNLPPSMCMRKEFVMLSLLIPGPSGPGHDIDVYLQPLIEELDMLWKKGAETYDSFTKFAFNMKAILLWTIHDFPAYGHISGCRTAGKYACPVCGEGIDSMWLGNGRKFAYMGCRRFLEDPRHLFRSQKSQFNGKEEHGKHPRRLRGSEVLGKMKKIQTTFGKLKGKKRARSTNEETTAWSKRSVFFELEYWEFLPIRHNLDVMHVEKNVAEILLSTIMKTKGKTKDGMEARKDLKAMKIKKKLWPFKNVAGKLTYEEAPFALSRSEREMMCRTLHQLKVPIGYSGNWKHKVDFEDFQLKNLKSHDYHIILQHLLPMLLMHAFKKHKPLREAIRQLSLFFNVLCSKVICIAELEAMEKRVVESLCVFEKYFPPSFFVSMVHLVLHLAEEAKVCGPVRYRWMYPFERMMKTFKGYVKNQTFPEGCITEQYLMNEAMRYNMEYIPASLRGSHKKGQYSLMEDDVEGAYPNDRNGKTYILSPLQYQQARMWNLKKHDEHAEWEEKHQVYLQRKKARDKSCKLPIQTELEYIPWLRRQFENEEMSTFKRLVDGPSFSAKSYKSYVINGYVFCTYDSELGTTTQNSGVSMKALTNFRASVKDKNFVEDEATYYGIVKQILELDYQVFKKIMFYCDWVRIEDKRNGCTVDPDTNLILVNLGRLQRNDNEDSEPFILAHEASQVFYCRDLSRDNWHVVLDAPKRLNVDVDAYEDPLVFDARTRALSSTSTNDILEDEED